ncbi:MAG: hypothetical protein ACE144_03345 [Thermodesulfobacteriota bacterium]
MRKSNAFLIFVMVGVSLFCLIFFHSFFRMRADDPLLQEMAQLVKRLELTDLCLCTEARYTRHPSQADLHTAFQDYPMSMEHFPAGSIIGPPKGIEHFYGKLDRETKARD